MDRPHSLQPHRHHRRRHAGRPRRHSPRPRPRRCRAGRQVTRRPAGGRRQPGRVTAGQGGAGDGRLHRPADPDRRLRALPAAPGRDRQGPAAPGLRVGPPQRRARRPPARSRVRDLLSDRFSRLEAPGRPAVRGDRAGAVRLRRAVGVGHRRRRQVPAGPAGRLLRDAAPTRRGGERPHRGRVHVEPARGRAPGPARRPEGGGRSRGQGHRAATSRPPTPARASPSRTPAPSRRTTRCPTCARTRPSPELGSVSRPRASGAGSRSGPTNRPSAP